MASTARGRLGRDAEREYIYTQRGGDERILACTDKLISECRIRWMLQGTELEGHDQGGRWHVYAREVNRHLAKRLRRGPLIFTREDGNQPFAPVPPT